MSEEESTVLIGGAVGLGALLLLCICYCVLSRREARREKEEPVLSARTVAPAEDASEEGKDDGEAEDESGEESEGEDEDSDSSEDEVDADDEGAPASAPTAAPAVVATPVDCGTTHLPGGKMKKERTKGGKETSARVEKRNEAKKVKRKDLIDGPGRFSLRGEKNTTSAAPAVAESPEDENTQFV